VSEFSHQIHNSHAQCICDYLERLNGNVTFATLNLSDVSAMQSGAFREDILGQLAPPTQFPNGGPELLLNVLHP
jgi:hypothetical protein